jgi:hypothetical protein
MTKEKTALTQLIEKLQQQKRILKESFEHGKWNDDRCSEIDNSIEIAQSLLPIEKQQIVDFANKCQLIEDIDCDGNVTFVYKPEDKFKEQFEQ